MQTRNTPPVDPRYWTAISLASIFGANLGDFVSHNLHMGHWRGLLPLGALLLALLGLERRAKTASQAWYWAAIVIVRTAATNLADLGTHDLRLGYGGVSLVLTALLCVVVWVQGAAAADSRTGALPKTNGWYWLGMLLAGTLGTAAGDALAGALRLGLGPASLLLSVLLAAAFGLRSRPAFRVQAFYWVTIVLVRTAGTTIGDLTAHTAGLLTSTVISGLALLGTLALWRSATLGARRDRRA